VPSDDTSSAQNVVNLLQMSSATTTSPDEPTITMESRRAINISNLNNHVKLLGDQVDISSANKHIKVQNDKIDISDVNGVSITFDTEHVRFDAVDSNGVSQYLVLDWHKS
jgi:hypothetical protein